MKKLLITAAVAGAIVGIGLSGAAVAAHASKIGIVDVAHVFKLAPQGDATMTNLKKNLEPKMLKLQKQHLALLKSAKSFQRNAPTLTAAKKASEQKDLVAKETALQKQISGLQKQEYAMGAKAATKFKAALKTAVATVAKQDKLSLVIMKQAVLYNKATDDVTATVVSTMKSAK